VYRVPRRREYQRGQRRGKRRSCRDGFRPLAGRLRSRLLGHQRLRMPFAERRAATGPRSGIESAQHSNGAATHRSGQCAGAAESGRCATRRSALHAPSRSPSAVPSDRSRSTPSGSRARCARSSHRRLGSRSRHFLRLGGADTPRCVGGCSEARLLPRSAAERQHPAARIARLQPTRGALRVPRHPL